MEYKLNNDIDDISKLINNSDDDLEIIILNDILKNKIKKLTEINRLKKNVNKKKLKNKVDDILDTFIKINEDDKHNQSIILKKKKDEEIKIKQDKNYNKIIDPKFENELKNDFSNNKLMERMNSELYNFNKKKKNNTILEPFSKELSDNYSNINNFENYTIPKNDFTINRLLKKN